jgi:hypothetical protein
MFSLPRTLYRNGSQTQPVQQHWPFSPLFGSRNFKHGDDRFTFGSLKEKSRWRRGWQFLDDRVGMTALHRGATKSSLQNKKQQTSLCEILGLFWAECSLPSQL